MIFKIILFILLFINILLAHDNPKSESFFKTHDLKQTKSKHILLLNSYHQGMPWFQSIKKGLNDILEPQKNSIVIHIEDMDSKRFFSKQYFEKLKKVYKLKYDDAHFDLILSTDNNAYEFLQKNKEELFKNTPVIFAGLNNYEKKKIVKRNEYTGVLEYHSYKENLDLIVKLHPERKKIYILNDYLKTGLAVKKNMQDTIRKENYDIEFLYNKNLKIGELQKELTSLSSDTVLYLGAYFTDKNGLSFTVDDFEKYILDHVNVPIYVQAKFRIANSEIGGVVIDGYGQGQSLGEMAKKYLNGTKIKDIPIERKSKNSTILNYPKLQKFGVEQQNIPKNAIIINKPFSLYENYKSTIWIIILSLSVLIIVIIKVQNSKKLEVKKLNEDLELKVEKRTKEIEKANIELNNTLVELKETQDYLIHAEKMASLGDLVAGVAHEINTPLGMSLTGITHFIDISKKLNNLYEDKDMSQDDFEEYLENTDKLAKSINTNLVKAAALIKSFKEIAVDQSSEAQRTFNLRSYLDEVLLSLHHEIKRKKHKIIIECAEDLVITSYPGAYSQIITNLIMNSFIHAFKNDFIGNITIELQIDNNKLFLTYTDDGKGILQENLTKIFDPFFTTNRKYGGSGLGLNIIFNIVNTTLKGKIECSSIEDIGVEFKIVIPLE